MLLHELAHAQRRDLLNQAIAKVVTAIYWFNPLAWRGYFQMLKWREIACDDMVLAHIGQPTDYAETLLQFANEVRRLEQQFVVGMARPYGITQRIAAILNSTRSRASFTKRGSRIALCIAAGVCLIAGTLQLHSQTDAAQEEKSAAQSQSNSEKNSEQKKTKEQDVPIDEQARSILIRILDEQSNPIVGADVYVTGADLGRRYDLPRIHYPTDTHGEATIKFRNGTLYLQLWTSKPAYVPQVTGMNEEELVALPSEYTFYLEKGSKLSGRIVDDSERPIVGAKVQIKTDGSFQLSELAKQNSPRPGGSRWLAEDGNAAITNDNGVWESFNAPSSVRNPQLGFKLLVDHPDFAGDRNWADYQTNQDITTEQLRNGTSTLVMDRGAVLRGTITGPDGVSVSKGLVIWVSNPDSADGVNETEIAEDGSFQLPNLEPGTYPITVLAPGYAPTQREVEISLGSPTCDFQLEAGNPIRLEIVDASGKPIPKASVSIVKWRGTEALYNDKLNASDSGISSRSDEHGIFAWDWAPSDGVEYRIHAAGYDFKRVTAIAKSEPHRIVLILPMMISGNVVDSTSSSPIGEFNVIPVKAFSPDWYSTDFQKNSGALGENGKYEIQINSQGESRDRFRVRIEAAGYRTAFGKKSLAAGEPPLTEDFELEPAAPLVGTVVTSDGQLANRFHVAIGTPTTSPSFRFERPDTFFGHAFEITGKSTFEIAASFETQRVRVFNDDGFAELVIPPDQPEIGQVVLEPYANLSGRLVQDGQPISAEGINFSPIAQRGLTEARFQDSFFTRTDPDGNFNFKRLPPMSGYVRAYLGPWQESPLTSSQSVPLELKPGQHQQLTLGGGGVQITGRVIAQGRDDGVFSKQWSLNWLVSRQPGVDLPSDAKPLSITAKSGSLDPAWLKRDDFSHWMNTKVNYFVKLREDGRLSIHGVPAGEYDLVIQLFDEPAGCLVEAVGTAVVPVTVTDEQVAAEHFDLGDIDVTCRVGPRPGSDMRAYQFANADGEVVYVDDLSGRYVLLHVWASWCAPCLASMPQLQAYLQEHADAPITAVGLNVDADKERGKACAKSGDGQWAQNYLGEDSAMARQLAVSSVPAYYLVGPDGKLVGSSNEWKQIEQLLKAKLEQ